MADEGERWRKAHPPEGRDGDDNMDEGRGGDEGMDEDRDDDIIPGCYILDMGIKKFLIRAEYIRMFDYIEAYFKEPGFPPSRPPCCVVTGQPGIGKSIWRFYALRRYLAQKQPVIWYRDKLCFLFVDEGVYQGPPIHRASKFRIFVPTLVDSDECISGVPEHLVTEGTRHAVIYTTSPNNTWKRLHKTVREISLIMNPWARKEILRAAWGLIGNVDEEHINDVFDRFGPTPRLCLEYSSNLESIKQYEIAVQEAISKVTTLAELERWFRDSRSLTMDSFSHKVCLIKRVAGSEVSGLPVIYPISLPIQSGLARQLRKVELNDQISLYRSLARVPDSRGVAGVIFESAGQRLLQDGIALDIIPMVRLRDSSRSGTLPQWYSSHVVLDNQSLEQSRQQALMEMRTITIPQSQIFVFWDGQQSSITPNVLYIPALSTQVALDSFMLLENLLYIFQFAIGSMSHDIEPGLIASLKKWSNHPPIEDWRFVFLMQPNQYVICPQSRSPDLQSLQCFSAVLDL